ncbi:hypothetical protein [Rock bream iridovirus]|uniref:ORF065L n=1 Tax=Rock bream iridovirus TaxID=263891 RepID=Q5YF22_ISKNV|nr:ORF065L [Rock bream iridovirus]AGG37947.1 hypothetical protein [Rock bream iridovirus]
MATLRWPLTMQHHCCRASVSSATHLPSMAIRSSFSDWSCGTLCTWHLASRRLGTPGATHHRRMPMYIGVCYFCNASSLYDWSAVRFDSVLPTSSCVGGVLHDSGLCVSHDLQGVAHVLGTVVDGTVSHNVHGGANVLGTVAYGTVSHIQFRGIVLATIVVRTMLSTLQ